MHLSLAAIVVTAVTLFCVNASAGWHQWSQSTRNQAIVDETAYWDTGDYGGQCKIWVQQEVVPNASGLTGLIPANNSNYCYWNYGPYVVGRMSYIENVQPGEIVQMKLSSTYGSGPHTLIVIGKSQYGIYVAESNWCSGNCEQVGFRYISYSDFYSQVSCFSIYYVL